MTVVSELNNSISKIYSSLNFPINLIPISVFLEYLNTETLNDSLHTVILSFSEFCCISCSAFNSVSIYFKTSLLKCILQHTTDF